MKKGVDTPAEAAERAEAQLRSKAAGGNIPRTVADMRRLLDELRRTWEELELSPNKYDKLYNFSPVGYFTFDAHGLIREVNSAGAEVLGIERRLLAGKTFFDFIADADDRKVFSNHLKGVLQSQAMQRCEIRLTRNDGSATYCQLQSVAVDVVGDEDIYILTAIVDGTFAGRFGENAHDKLELTGNERTGELSSSLQFLAHVYRFFGNPQLDHDHDYDTPESTGEFGTLSGAAIVKDGNPEESAQSSISARWEGWKNSGFSAIEDRKNIRLYGLCGIAVVAAVAFALLQPKGKTTGSDQKRAEKITVRSFALQTSVRKMNQEKELFAVIKFKVSPKGAIYIDGEKRGVAPTLREVQVKKGKYTIAIKYKNYKVYRRVVNLAPQQTILIQHSFRKNTMTAKTKHMTVGRSTSKREKALQEGGTNEFPETAATDNITAGKPAPKVQKAPQKISPAAFSATFTPD